MNGLKILLVILVYFLSIMLMAAAINISPSDTFAPGNVIQDKNIIIQQDKLSKFIIDMPGEELLWGGLEDTNSMLPTMDYGHDLILIKCPCEIKTGDIVGYTKKNDSGNAVIHRVIKIKGNDIKTKGDNNLWGEWILREQISFKVIGILY